MNHPSRLDNAFQALLLRFFANEIRAWNGQERLAKVFWLSGVLTSSILIVLYSTTIYLHQLVAEQVLLIFLGIYTIWVLVSIWRCALATRTFWSDLARLLTVAWAVNVAMVLVFRQIELLMLFANGLGTS